MKFVIEHLSKKFGAKEVLRDISFTFESGKIYGLLGRNGAGKTTLFNCLNRDLKADGGSFYFLAQEERQEVVPEDVGYVLSTPTVPEFLTAREFLKFFMDINEKRLKNPKTMDEYFDFLGIETEDRDKLLKDYSHGMKNKMQMLVNFILRPKLFLLDEPLTSLDVVVSEEMKQLLRSMKKDRVTIFSTHIMDLALDLCDEIVLLNHGVLELVDQENLDNLEFKEKIIAALREEGHEKNISDYFLSEKYLPGQQRFIFSKTDPSDKKAASRSAVWNLGTEDFRECDQCPVGTCGGFRRKISVFPVSDFTAGKSLSRQRRGNFSAFAVASDDCWGLCEYLYV